MLSEPLLQHLSNYLDFLNKKFPKRHLQQEAKDGYDRLYIKYHNAFVCLIQKEMVYEKFASIVNVDITTKWEKLTNDFKANFPTKERGGQLIFDGFVAKDIERLRNPKWEATKNEDINGVLFYLELPIDEWPKYHLAKPKELSSIFNELIPTKAIDKKILHKIGRCWWAYMYNPDLDVKKVFKIPVAIEKVSDNAFEVNCRTLTDQEVKGYAFMYGNYLTIFLTDANKRRMINLQTFINHRALDSELILNTAVLWVQKRGKPMLSIILLDRAKRPLNKADLPHIRQVNFDDKKKPNDPKSTAVNNYIEYVSRKGEPELAARYFKKTGNKGIEERNEEAAIVYHRPRKDFLFLKEHLVDKPKSQKGEYISFSRIFSHLDTPQEKTASCFHWVFEADTNSRIIKATRTVHRKSGRTYEGIVQLEESHFSIFFTDINSKGFKHFLAPLSADPPFPTVLKGVSSTIYNQECLALREILVFATGYNLAWEKEGRIPWGKFEQLPYLTEINPKNKDNPFIYHYKHLEDSDNSILYS